MDKLKIIFEIRILPRTTSSKKIFEGEYCFLQTTEIIGLKDKLTQALSLNAIISLSLEPKRAREAKSEP